MALRDFKDNLRTYRKFFSYATTHTVVQQMTSFSVVWSLCDG